MNEQHIIKLGYNITSDPHFQAKQFGIPPELDNKLEALAYEAQDKKNKTIIGKLTNLIVEYPTVPILKNYLSVAYNIRGNHKKSIEINNWTLSEHPDYLFARLNKANEYIENDQTDKVPQILGEALEIKQLYPNRDIFHLTEVTNYYKVVIRYYAAIDNLELAENRLEILTQIAPDHHDTEDAETYLFNLRMKRAADQMTDESEQIIAPHQLKNAPTSTNTSAPQFNHAEVNCLYKYGMEINPDNLREILALPRQSLINDMEKILDDAADRFHYFQDLGWEEETQSFVIHSLFLLKEINATESLPKILSFLEYDYDFLNFWLGDHKTETLWQCLFVLGLNNTPVLKQFLLKPGIDTYAKTAVSEALCQISLHCPERKPEILEIYKEVFTVISQATLEDNIIDSEFLGLSIADAIDCDMAELLPIISILFEKQYVSIGIAGDYNDVKEAFTSDYKEDFRRDVLGIFDLYNFIQKNWAENNEDPEYDSYNPYIQQQAVSSKIGRNEPCPCGSGKKYKKCCLKEQ